MAESLCMDGKEDEEELGLSSDDFPRSEAASEPGWMMGRASERARYQANWSVAKCAKRMLKEG